MELKNKRFAFLGDSITEGVGTTGPDKTFHQLIAKECEMSKAYNSGIGATRIARQTVACDWHAGDVDFVLRTAILPRDLDGIVIFGGTNDYGHGDAKFGEKDSTDVYTFYGALNTLFTILNRDFPNTKIICMTPIHRLNENNPSYPEGKVLSDYVDAIKETAAKYNVAIADAFEEAPIDPADPELVPDGLHPSDKGHRVLADFLIEKLKAL